MQRLHFTRRKHRLAARHRHYGVQAHSEVFPNMHAYTVFSGLHAYGNGIFRPQRRAGPWVGILHAGTAWQTIAHTLRRYLCGPLRKNIQNLLKLVLLDFASSYACTQWRSHNERDTAESGPRFTSSPRCASNTANADTAVNSDAQLECGVVQRSLSTRIVRGAFGVFGFLDWLLLVVLACGGWLDIRVLSRHGGER